MTNALTALSSISEPALTPTVNSDISTAQPITIDEFSGIKQANLFKSLKQNQFSGQLIFWDPQGVVSIFHLFHGRIVFVTGGHQPSKRWTRNLKLYCPALACELNVIDANESIPTPETEEMSWQYRLLSSWLKQKKINREQVFRLIRGLVSEMFFDLTQAQQVTYILKSDKSCSTPIILINPEEIIVDAWKLWLEWQKADLAAYSANLVPVISHPEQLDLQALPSTCKVVIQCLDGEASLRDLAIKLQQDILSLTRSLLLYVQWGLVKFVEFADLNDQVESFPANFSLKKTLKQHLVVYVDDNLEMSRRMRDWLTSAGYQYITVHNRLEAVAICLEQNPDLIIINAQMSNSSGYQICYQLRQFSFLCHTPIIMLADKISMIDKIRAKFGKVVEILPKFADKEQIITTLFKSLTQETAI
ncbi:response regulator [Gloeothece verrucosa]|uniref:Protein PatA n=1 Tax=Gloeothece verrucosa (strain PCC 7822) TaxID=497965 RepID=E0UCZ2_GLOV7|nr:response regulator [Gloeothece verrucosa]ADN16457.1 response regulator receiver protein [Gloeothece verrucosa PCC 7822]